MDNETLADRIEAAAKREMAKGMSKKLDGNRSIPGNAAEMRKALERILDIEGYGAPWIEAKVIAQKALEGEQCTPPIAQESPKIEQQGNAAAMRKALKAAKTLLENTDFDADSDLDDAAAPVMAQIAVALAAPPRNCDAGTAEEQAKRFATLCNKYYDDENPCDKRCPLAQMDFIHGFPRCQAFWGQLPCEEGGAE